MNLLCTTHKVVEGRVIRMAERPLSFAQFLDLVSKNDDLELVKFQVEQLFQNPLPNEFTLLQSLLAENPTP